MDEQEKSNPNSVEAETVEMTDINGENSETSGKQDNEDINKSSSTKPSQDADSITLKPPATDMNGDTPRRDSDLLERRTNRANVASMRLPNIGIQHDDVCVALKDADADEEEEEEGRKNKEDADDEIQVSSPMISEKTGELRPYSIAVDVMFKRKDTKSKHKKICLIGLAILLAVLLIGGIIAVLVIFLGDIDGPDPELVAIQGEFRLSDRPFNSAYEDSNTQEYQQLQQEFINEMDNLYMNSTYKDIYVGTEVSGFRTGSIIVAFVVQLKRLENAITPSPDDPDVNQSNDVRYREAGDFIFESVDQGQGMLGKLTGSVINLTLVLGDGKPVERVTPKAVPPPIDPTTTPSPTSRTSRTTTTPTTTVSTTVQMKTTKVTLPAAEPTSSMGPDATTTTTTTMNEITTSPDTSTKGVYKTTEPEIQSFTDVVTMVTTQEVECTPVDIVECMDILPFNMSTTPNPHGLGNTAADIRNTYDMFSTHINNQCHPEGTKVLCSLLHTRCTAETFNLFMAFLETYIPCRSLCLEVDSSCLGSGNPINFSDLCDALPESADSSICYRSPSATGPSSCTPGMCLNNGSCLVIMEQTMCRCPDGFIGETCEIRSVDPCLSSPCQNGGECQPEPPALPGASLIYFCKCQRGYFGKHCAHVMDGGMGDVPDVPIVSECSGDLVISECADIVPYNISAAVNADQQTAKDWDVILSQANTCHGDAGIFVCAVLQRKCTVDGPILPCRALCERVAHCDLTSSDLPYSSRSCGTYPDSLNYLDCFDVMYEG